jgi:hypothetical protein
MKQFYKVFSKVELNCSMSLHLFKYCFSLLALSSFFESGKSLLMSGLQTRTRLLINQLLICVLLSPVSRIKSSFSGSVGYGCLK